MRLGSAPVLVVAAVVATLASYNGWSRLRAMYKHRGGQGRYFNGLRATGYCLVFVSCVVVMALYTVMVVYSVYVYGGTQ
jgi:hypothetical protein